MKSNYKQYIILVFITSMCLNTLLNAAVKTDSTIQKQENHKNIAFGSQPEWKISSSISSIKGSELQKTFTSNLANALYGRLPGLTVMQGSGEPGYDSPSLHIRGLNTFSEGNSPLIIVDGIESSFEQLTTYEIESIVLLKDASATAIYGSRGANGIVLITTKRGMEGPLKVNFSSQLGFQQAARLPDFLDSYDYSLLYNEALENDGEAPIYTNEDLEAFKTGDDPYFHPNVDWYDEVLRKTAPISNYNLNFSGGDKTVKYFVLLNVLSNDGLYKKTSDLSENSVNASYERFNFRSNVDIKLTKRMSASLSLGGSIEDRATPAGNDTWSLFNLMSSIPPNAFPIYNPDGSYGGNSLYTNPLGDVLETGYYSSNGRTLQASFKLTEDLGVILPGLSISSAISYNTYFLSYSNKTREYERSSISKDSTDNIVYTTFGQNTSLEGDENRSNQWQNFTFQTFLNYKQQFGINDLDVLIMYYNKEYTSIGRTGSVISTGSILPFKHIGGGGRITNTIQDKYIGELIVGYNGSENFAEGSRFGLFPAISLGWIVSNEDFFKQDKAISYLKVRASFGITGNDNIGGERFMFDPSFPTSNGYFFGGSNIYGAGIVQGRVANPNVTWESEQKLNIGIEASILNKIDISLDLFNQDRSDILAIPYSDVPQFLGLTLPYLNIGKVNNKGFEAILRYNGNQSKELHYFIETNIWYAINKIEYNAEALQSEEYLYKTGRSVGQPFLLESIGFFESDDDIANSPLQTFAAVQPGDLKYKDQNDDNVIDNKDYYPLGNPDIPKLTVGLHTGLLYKGFDLDVFFQAVTGNSVYLQGTYFEAFQNNAQVSSIAIDRWHSGNTEDASYPRLSATDNLNNFKPSTFWLRDGSFIKLRSLELGYTLSEQFSKKIRLEKAKVFLNGTNLFSIDHVKYTDPETLYGYQAARSVSLGIRIQF